MRAKSLVLLILALGCGLVASIGINQYLSARSDTPAETPEGTVLVLVANQEIPKSMKIDESMIRLEHWPEASAPGGSINDTALAVGRAVKQTVFPGEPLLELKLAEPGAEGADSTIPKGLRAFTVKVNTESGVAGFIQPGARVDVTLSVSRSPDVPTPLAKTILMNIEVWAVDQQIHLDEDDPQATPAKAVTLLVTPKQVEILTLATSHGKVYLALRNNIDDGEEPSANPVTMRDLTGSRAESTSDINPLKSMISQTVENTEPPEVTVGPSHTMVISRGSEEEKITFSLD